MTETPITPEIAPWVRPGTGQRRRYINNWRELCGIHLEHYNSGSISSCWIDDIGAVSNSKAAGVSAGRVWLDDADVLHFDQHARGDVMSTDVKRERITAALRDAGVL